MIKYLIIFCLFAFPVYAETGCDITQPHTDVDGVCTNMTSAQVTALQAAEAASQANAAFKSSVEAALANGVVVTSTGTPALNGTYAIDPISQGQLNAVVTYILLNGSFPGGNVTMPWTDASGAVHVFPSVTAFKGFATAYADYTAAVVLYEQSAGQAGSLPSNAITIP